MSTTTCCTTTTTFTSTSNNKIQLSLEIMSFKAGSLSIQNRTTNYVYQRSLSKGWFLNRIASKQIPRSISNTKDTFDPN